MRTRAQVVRVFSRGLDVLRVLNERGEASAGEIVRLTSLPRPTVHRLLNTLVADGYVAPLAQTRRYRATQQVRALSQGYREEVWVSEAAEPVLAALQRDIAWPSSVATYRDRAMVIRHTTHGISPLSIADERAGSRLPLLGSALGRAYLAFAAPQVREAVLALVTASCGPERELARNRPLVEAMLAPVMPDGHAERVGGSCHAPSPWPRR